jgi:hypothetical protein
MSRLEKLLLTIIILIGTHTAAFFYGKSVESDNRDAKELTLIEDKIKEGKEKAKTNYDIELAKVIKDYNRKMQELKRNDRIANEIKNDKIYTSSDCNIPTSGLQIWNDEARGSDSKSTPGEVDGKVPRDTTNSK